MCDVFASHTIELKPAESGYKFLLPFVCVLVICMCVMVMFTVSSCPCCTTVMIYVDGTTWQLSNTLIFKDFFIAEYCLFIVFHL